MTTVDLKHLPDTMSLPKAWLKVSLLLLVAVAFVIGGAALSQEGDRTGMFVVVFFGLCVAVFIWALMGRSGVELDRDGFTVRSLFASHRYAWRDVSEFSHRRVGRTHMFLFDDLKKADGALAKVNRFMSGHNAGFPAAFIGGSRDETCAILNAFRARGLSR